MHRTSRLFIRTFALATIGLFAFLHPRQLPGQAATATITGTVTDSTGAALPDAAISAKNTGTGVIRNTTSDGQGRYTLPDLAIGQYDVEAKKMGFQTVTRRSVTLTVGSLPVADFQLPVGQTEQTVNVEGAVSAVETETSSVSSLVNQSQMRELPLNGRNFEQLILLAPGAVSYPAGGSSALVGRAATFSVSGARPEGHAILLDGENLQDWWQRGSGANVSGTSLGIESIAEFQTLTNTYGAQYGGNGSVVNAVTKSGTNSFHGSAFDFLRNSQLDARNFFDVKSPPPFRRNQFGGSVGGPIRKDKLFFFANYEGIRQLLGVTSLVTVPDSNARNGLLPCKVVDATRCDATGANLINVGVAPSVAPLLALYPAPVTQLSNGLANATTVANQVVHEDYVLARVDYAISEKDAVFVRYVSDVAQATFPPAIPLWPVNDHNHNQFSTIQERHVFSPTLLNQFSFSFSRPLETETEPFNAPGGVLQAFPGRQDVTISVTGLSALGANFTNPFRFLENKFTEEESLLWTKGSHNLKFGMHVRRHQINSYSYTYWNGNYTFPGLVALLTASPTLFTGARDGEDYGNRDFRDISLKPYFEDDWKVTRRLTLNLGIRYEFQTNPIEQHNNLHNLVNPPFGTAYSLVPNAFKTNPNVDNWDPRFGFAYDIFGDHKTSLRGGFGMFHDPAQTYVFFSGYVGTPPFNSLNQVNPSFPIPFQGAGVSAPLPSLTFGTDYTIHKTPYMMQYNLNIERELFNGSVLTVGYVGSRGVDLLSFRDYNPPVPQVLTNGQLQFGNPATGISYTRINPAFGTQVLTNPGSSSHYNSLQTSFNNRFGSNFVGNLSYVYSHCTDGAYTYGGLGGNNGTSAWTNPYDGSRERGNCGFDIRHNLALNVVYLLPFHGNRLVEGWQVSGIESWRTGVPISVGIGYDRALLSNNFASVRPDVIAGCDQTANQTPQHWFNAACYTLPAPGTVGNLGKNTVTAPGYEAVDFSLSKDTRIFERVNAQFRAEIFNIFNHSNFGIPFQNAFTAPGSGPLALVAAPTGALGNAANAGQITSIVGTSRQIQFGLKFLF
ncbi:MAG TPA: carboxypeptidase regulatory-like domain-containing protein [Bryobacteraceae bacterium]|nr:carboxypeptidase regulatory-like domain-containing protein [Bryobacteraceae bacterium]